MPRRKKAFHSWAKKAQKMREVYYGKAERDVLNNLQQDPCDNLSLESTSSTLAQVGGVNPPIIDLLPTTEAENTEVNDDLSRTSEKTSELHTPEISIRTDCDDTNNTNSFQVDILTETQKSTEISSDTNDANSFQLEILTETQKSTEESSDTNGANSFQLEISTQPQKSTKESPFLEGRRIIHMGHFFSKLKEIAVHGPMNCGLGSIEIVGERQTGLESKFTLQCKMCNMKFIVESDSPDELNINYSAVVGTIAIGCGLWQLQELTAALNLPVLSTYIYKQSHERVSKEIKKISIDSMNQAAQKERDLALAEGRIDKDGIPIIDVIADGCWSKRTYKKNYSALSGAAAIIGKKTGEVLFLGIKNKYCCICAQAEKKQKEPNKHVCYKNYNGPSTAMESDILLEGFKCSIDMHNIIYGRLISDGDSNTYAKILKNRPYSHITVEKIECRNHVLRNLCNKLASLPTETKFPLKFRKLITQKKIMILRKTIRKIIKFYNTDSESQRRCNIELLYNDVLLSHLHVFGDHSRCKAYFCTDTNKTKLDDAGKDFFTSTLWTKICSIMSNVASHAPSLVHDVDSNMVERYNSVVAKLIGGKRVNFSLRGSYQTRCQAAVISFNSHKMISSLYKSVQGRSPTGKIKKLEKNRLQRMANQRKTVRKKNRLLFMKGTDASYGEQCEKPDKHQDVFEMDKKKFLNKLIRSDREREEIQKTTILQSSCSEWLEIRRCLLTASNFRRVIKRRQNISCANIVKDIIYKESLSHVGPIKHGRDNEIKAIEKLKSQENVSIEPCGLYIDKDFPFLGATPDGVIGSDTIVEVKCPLTAFNDGLEEAIKKKKVTFYKCDEMGNLKINKAHNWYFQIQGQLHITNKSQCLFGLWYGEDNPVKTELIKRDDVFWEKQMKEKLQKFYLDCMLPELVDPRHTRNMKIRDPEYIEQALEEKKNKKEKENIENNQDGSKQKQKTAKGKKKDHPETTIALKGIFANKNSKPSKEMINTIKFQTKKTEKEEIITRTRKTTKRKIASGDERNGKRKK